MLVHGAGEDPSVWEGWEGVAIDLHAGLNVTEASMLNYEAVVTCDAALVPRPLCVVGRGMGSLAARMAAHRLELDALVLIDPWPAEGSPGLEPGGMRPESALALAECRRGVSVQAVSSPTLELEGEPDPQAVAAWARSASASAT